MAKKRKTRTIDQSSNVAGASPDPATNLLMADIAMRAGSTVLRKLIERGILKGRYGRDTAKDIVNGRTIKQTLATAAVAKIATRSFPGAVVVGTGLAAKMLFDRAGKRRKVQRSGDAKLLDQAAEE